MIFFAACSKGPDAPRAGLSIATSIFPVYDIARNIAGDRAEVSFLVPPGANPHVYEPKPSEVKNLSGAGIFIGVDPRFDGWMERFLPADAAKLYLSGNDANPHVWLSVKKAMTAAQKIADALILHDPDGAGYYRENLARYLESLRDLDKKLSAQFARCGKRSFIQWHAAWDYLAADYGLTVFATIESGHGKEVSVKRIRDIALGAKRSGVTVISAELRDRNTAVETLRDEIGGTVVRLDPIGDPGSAGRNTYIDMMKYNASALCGALR